MYHKIDNTALQYSSLAPTDGHPTSDMVDPDLEKELYKLQIIIDIDIIETEKIMEKLNTLINDKF